MTAAGVVDAIPVLVILLFDVDLTLVDSGGAGMRAFSAACEEVLGIPRAVAAGVRPHGKTDPLILDEVLEAAGRPRADEAARQAVKGAYLHRLTEGLTAPERYRVLPGVPALLARLADDRNLRLGLGTGNWEAGARIKLAPAGLNDRFTFGGYGEDGPARPDVLRAGAARAGVAGPVVVIGDTILDVQAARACGFGVVGVTTGGTTADVLLGAGADRVLPDLADAEAAAAVLRAAAGRSS